MKHKKYNLILFVTILIYLFFSLFIKNIDFSKTIYYKEDDTNFDNIKIIFAAGSSDNIDWEKYCDLFYKKYNQVPGDCVEKNYKKCNKASITFSESSSGVELSGGRFCFSRKNYIQVGWNTKSDGSGISFKVNQNVNFSDFKNIVGVNDNNTKTITLYPEYSPSYSKIIYDGDGANGTMPSSIIKASSNYQLLKNKFTKEHYNFIGWEIENNLYNENDVISGDVFNAEIIPTSSKTFIPDYSAARNIDKDQVYANGSDVFIKGNKKYVISHFFDKKDDKHILVVFDYKTGAIVNQYVGLHIGHGNGITYNEDNHKFYITLTPFNECSGYTKTNKETIIEVTWNFEDSISIPEITNKISIKEGSTFYNKASSIDYFNNNFYIKSNDSNENVIFEVRNNGNIFDVENKIGSLKYYNDDGSENNKLNNLVSIFSNGTVCNDSNCYMGIFIGKGYNASISLVEKNKNNNSNNKIYAPIKYNPQNRILSKFEIQDLSILNENNQEKIYILSATREYDYGTNPSTYTRKLDVSELDNLMPTTVIKAKWKKKSVLNIRYNANGGVWANLYGSSMYTMNNDGFILKNNEINIHVLEQGDTSDINLANYNNSSFINLIKMGYHVPSDKEWYQISGNNTKIYYNQNNLYKINDFSNIDNEDKTVSLFVNWVPNTYKVTFDKEGGTGGTNLVTATYNSSMPSATAPTKTGYTFLGYYDGDNGTGTQYYDASMNSKKNFDKISNTTLYAKWNKINYSITYNLVGGAVTPSNPTSYNIETSTITLNNPTKVGYTFTGWTGSNETTPSKTVTIPKGSTGDKSYTANYTIKKYTVSFNSNGGSSINSVEKEYNSTIGNLPTPTKEGYSFDGWYIGNTKIDSNYKVVDSVELTAKWNKGSYTITYNLDGGSVTPSNPTSYDIETSSITLNNPTKDGYTFTGWTGSNGTTPNKTVTIPKGSTGDKNYTANYRKNILNIRYNSNGGILATNHGSSYTIDSNNFILNNGNDIIQTAEYGGTIGSAGLVNYNNPSYVNIEREHYHIDLDKVWNTKSDGSGTNYNQTSAYNVSKFADLSQSDKTVDLYLNWIINKYTVTFNSNGGSSVSSIEKEYNKTIGTLTTPTKEGYTFDGWYIGNTKIDSNYKVVEDIELTAKWNKGSYTITYNLDGGTVTSNPTSYNIETNTFTLNNPTKVGYTFTGWTGSNGTTPNKTVTIPKGSTGNKSYTANYSINKYTVTFNSSGGSSVSSIEKEYNTSIGTLPTPTKEGYTFDGWYIGNVKIDSNYKVVDNVELTAKWNKGSYTITYNLDGGSVSQSNPTSYNIETSTITLNNPTKVGYTFTGWTGSNGTTPNKTVKIEKGSTGNKSYTANYTINKYTVTFNSNGGSSINSVEKEYNTSVGNLPTPTKEGYIFDGWYIGNTKIDSNYKVVEDIELTAKWNKGSYTITYNLDGGSVTPSNQTSYDIETNAFTLNNPTKVGYTFTGWTGSNGNTPNKTVTIPKGSTGNKSYTANYSINKYTVTFNSNGGLSVSSIEKEYNSTIGNLPTPTRSGYTFDGWYIGNTKIDSNYKVVEDIELTAKWNKGSYTITYNLDGGSVTPSNQTSYDIETNAFTLNNPTKVGYTFTGWTGSNGNTPNKTVTIPKGSTENRAYIANYDINKYTVTFNSNGGTNVNGVEKEYNSSIGTLPTTTKKGYILDGWYVTLTGGDKVNENTKVVDNITLYARWLPITYKVIFNSNDGSNLKKEQVITYDELTRLDNNSYERSGYIFNSWNTKSDGTGNSYSNNAEVKNLKEKQDEIINLYAIWDKGEYSITYNLDGGNTHNPTSYDVETNTFTLNNPTKTGYTFIGWTGTGLNSKTMTVTIPKGSTGNKEFTANYEINKYKITFINDGNEDVKELDYNSVIEIPEDEKEGYKFLGWYDDDNNLLVDGDKVPAEDITYKVKYEPIKYKIIYQPNGGYGSMEEQIITYDEEVNLFENKFKKANHEFIGWTIDSDEVSYRIKDEVIYKDKEKVKNLTTEDNKVITLHAVWKENKNNSVNPDKKVKVENTFSRKNLLLLFIGISTIISGFLLIKYKKY